jgi:hypothetical protein
VSNRTGCSAGALMTFLRLFPTGSLVFALIWSFLGVKSISQRKNNITNKTQKFGKPIYFVYVLRCRSTYNYGEKTAACAVKCNSFRNANIVYICSFIFAISYSYWRFHFSWNDYSLICWLQPFNDGLPGNICMWRCRLPSIWLLVCATQGLCYGFIIGGSITENGPS